MRKILCGLALAFSLGAAADSAWAQQGSSTRNDTSPLTGAPSLTPIPSTTAPGTTPAPQPPTLDPYANPSMAPPSLLSPSSPPAFGTTTPGLTQPLPYSQPSTPALSPQPYPGYQQPLLGFPSQNPPVLFPNGLFGPRQPASAAGFGAPLKWFQNVRLSHAWLNGDGDRDLRVNDTFITTTMAYPNFFWTGQPWFVSPGFGLHLWSGPWLTTGPARFFPSKAYSAFLDAGWKSDPNRVFGVETSGRIGVFTDFDHIRNDSVRPSGMALMRYNLTPNVALKAGVEYINRADIKLLPAGGILWTPNTQTRFDIYFPQPKFASYLTTLGNWDLWWYVAGEYGGGVWTLRYDDGRRSLTDINDIRLLLGLELGPPSTGGVGQRGAFFEVGYVWDREIVVVVAGDRQKLKDTIMLRGGIAF